MDFTYYDSENVKRRLDLKVGANWSEFEAGNTVLNSIFTEIDDGDGMVSDNEFFVLKNLFKKADDLVAKTKGNNIIEFDELKELYKNLEKGKIDVNAETVEVLKNIDIKNYSLENLRKRFPEDKFDITYCDEYVSVYKKDSWDLVLSVDFADNKITDYHDYTGENFLSSEYKDGKIIEYRDRNGWHDVEIENIVNSLYEQIYQKNAIGFPKTATQLGELVSKITPKNVMQILNEYSRLAGKDANLLEDLIGELGIDIDKRLEYLMHIKNAILEKYKKLDVYVDDISAEFDAELQIQKDKIGFANADYLNVFIDKLRNRRYVSSEEKNVAPNGKIDADFKQGATGDCWLVASIIAIARNPKGKEILDNTVKVNPDGSVTVHLKGVDKKYTISKEELEGNTQLSTGDLDVRAIEIAFNKYFYEERGVNSNVINGLISNRLDINGNQMLVAYRILVGNKNIDNGENNIIQFYAKGLKHYKKLDDDFIDQFNDTSKIITVSSHDKGDEYSFSGKDDEKVTLYGNHAYAIKGSDENNVYLINPWDSSKVLTVPREEFKKFFNYYNLMEL